MGDASQAQKIAAIEPASKLFGVPTKGSISQLETAVRDEPSPEILSALGLAYLQRVRERGDATDYQRAETALTRARKLDPRSYTAIVGLATLATARHEFPTALERAQEAERLQPASSDALGIKGDAQLELGRTSAAFATFDRMVALKPTLASYSRVSYGRELSGDRAGAIEALSFAIDAGSSRPEHVAFALVHRGNLKLANGNVAGASEDYREALDRVPAHAASIAGQARVAYARGEIDEAVRLLDRAIAVVPLPEYAILQSDILVGANRSDDAGAADRLVDAMAELLRSNGVDVDLELALYDLDRDHDVRSALKSVERVYESRKSIEVEDVLAWGLRKNGRCNEALTHSKRALELGTKDGLKMFHRAEIEACLGRSVQARAWYRKALAANSWFSPLHVARARAGARG